MNHFTDKQGFPIMAALIFYIAAGVIALSLYSLDSAHLPWNVSVASTQGSALYDIPPELSATPGKQANMENLESDPASVEPDTASEQINAAEEAQNTVKEVHYYAFTTSNKYGRLRVRKQPDVNAEIVYRLAPGSTGYILERGDDWSLIQTPDATGYSYNEYLEIYEVSEEEYLRYPVPPGKDLESGASLSNMISRYSNPSALPLS